MGTTAKYGLIYPEGTVSPNGPLALQALGESIEDALDTKIWGPWKKLTLGTGWTDYVGGGNYRNGAWYRLSSNLFQLSLMVRSNQTGTLIGSTIATIPVDDRVAYGDLKPAIAQDALAQVGIGSPDGKLTYRTGVTNPTHLCLNVTIPRN